MLSCVDESQTIVDTELLLFQVLQDALEFLPRRVIVDVHNAEVGVVLSFQALEECSIAIFGK